MTFSEKGLIKAMKRAYREEGYTVAQTETGLLITADGAWGVGIPEGLVPNVVKGLIVSHAGKLPGLDRAIHVHKDDVSNEIYEMAVGRCRDIKAAWDDSDFAKIGLTRLTMDGMHIWQRQKDLKMVMTHPDDMLALDLTDREAYQVDGVIFCENFAGICWVEPRPDEDKSILVKHLEQMQFIAGVDA